MSKTSSDPGRQALSGPTMGTRWSALFYTTGAFDPTPVRSALQAAVDEVDEQMSNWKLSNGPQSCPPIGVQC